MLLISDADMSTSQWFLIHVDALYMYMMHLLEEVHIQRRHAAKQQDLAQVQNTRLQHAAAAV